MHVAEDEETFNSSFDSAFQKNSARKAIREIGKTKQSEKINPIYKALERTSVKSNFHGYDTTRKLKMRRSSHSSKTMNELKNLVRRR